MKRGWIGLLLAGWMLLSPTPSPGEEAGLMQQNPAREILLRAYRHLDGLERFSLEALTINEEVYREKMVREVRNRIRVALQRPDRLRIDLEGESGERSYFFRAGIFDLYDRSYRLYGQLSTPESIDGMLDRLYDDYGIASPLANLLYSDLEKRLVPRGRSFYFGIQRIEGVPCHYLGFVNQSKELQVWVQAEGEPWIRKFVIIDKSTPWRLHSATTLRWKPAAFGKEWFDFVPPKDALRIPIVPAKGGRGI